MRFADYSSYRRKCRGRSTSERAKRRIENGLTSYGGRGYWRTDHRAKGEARECCAQARLLPRHPQCSANRSGWVWRDSARYRRSSMSKRRIMTTQPSRLCMNHDDLTDEDRAFRDALARKIWQARREGALIGCLPGMRPGSVPT